MGELLRAVQGQPNILDAFLRAQEYQRQIGRQEQNMRLQLAQQALARMYRQQELDYQNQRLAMEGANYASEDAWRKANMQREGIAAAAKAYGEGLRPNDQYKQNPTIGPPQELTPEQQSLLVGPNPDDIANAYGVPPETFRQIAQGVLQQSTQAWKEQQAKAQADAQKAAEEKAYKDAQQRIEAARLGISQQELGLKKQEANDRSAGRGKHLVQTDSGWGVYDEDTNAIYPVTLQPGVKPKESAAVQKTQQLLDFMGGGAAAPGGQPQSAPSPAPQAQPQAAPTPSAPSGPPVSGAVIRSMGGQRVWAVPLGGGKYRIVGNV
jgi:hypothetical protein